MAQERVKAQSLRRALGSHPLWIGMGFTSAATLLAFLGPYDLPGVWKGIVPAAGTLLTTAQAAYVARRRATPIGRVRRAVLRRARNQILACVREQWIDQLLDPELLPVVLELQLCWAPGAVNVAFPTPARNGLTRGPLDPGTGVGDLLQQAGRALLLLGPGGSGKTTLLARAAEQLACAADTDAEAPLPVPLRLSTWRPSQGPLASWVCAEVARRYRVPAAVTERWLGDANLVLLLDGLDEILADERKNAVSAVNEFLRLYGLNGVIVTSRREEYDAVGVRLELDSAAELAQLRVGDLPGLLAGPNGDPTALRGVFEADPSLAELFETPLMIAVGAAAFHQLQPTDLLGASVADRRAVLFDSFVADMLRRPRRLPLPGRNAARFTRWLHWLARGSDQWFTPRDLGSQWLPRGWRRRLVTLCAPLIVGALTGGISTAFLGLDRRLAVCLGLGVALLLVPDDPTPSRGPLLDDRDDMVAVAAALLTGGFTLEVAALAGVRGLAVVLIIAVAWAAGPLARDKYLDLYFSDKGFAVAGLAGGLAAGSAAELASWWPARTALAAAVCVAGPPVACGMWFGVFTRTEPSGTEDGPRRAASPLRRFASGAATGVFVSLGVALALPIAAGLVIAGAEAIAVLPSVAAAGGMLVFVLALHTAQPEEHLHFESVLPPLAGCAVGITGGWPSGLLGTLVAVALLDAAYSRRERDGLLPVKRPIVHALLAVSGEAPWRLQRFLDGATDRLLLRRIEGRYTFRHALLREHLANRQRS